MSINSVEKVKLTAKEKAFVRANLPQWQKEPEGEAWSDNMRLLVTWSHGISFTVYRDKYRHDGQCAGVNDWRGRSPKEVLEAVAA